MLIYVGVYFHFMNIALKDSTAAIVKCNFQFDNRFKCAPDPKKTTFHQGSLLLEIKKKHYLIRISNILPPLPLHKQFKYPVRFPQQCKRNL